MRTLAIACVVVVLGSGPLFAEKPCDCGATKNCLTSSTQIDFDISVGSDVIAKLTALEGQMATVEMNGETLAFAPIVLDEAKKHVQLSVFQVSSDQSGTKTKTPIAKLETVGDVAASMKKGDREMRIRVLAIRKGEPSK